VSRDVETGKWLSAVQAVEATSNDEPFACMLAESIGLESPDIGNGQGFEVKVERAGLGVQLCRHSQNKQKHQYRFHDKKGY
jgi:hypothetical protein